MRTKQQMFEDIRGWEMDAGEDFLDYFDGSLNEFNFMFWCLGKGYIDESQLQAFEKDNNHGSAFLYGDEVYSVVNENDYEFYNEGYEYSYTILAEFLVSTETYQRRVEEFLSGISKIRLEDVLRNLILHEHVFIKYQGGDIYADANKVLEVPLGKILATQWYRKN